MVWQGSSGFWAACFISFYTCWTRNYGFPMANRKNKKKKIIKPLSLKWFPGYDFYFVILIVLIMVVLAICSGCYSPDTVYVREYYQPRTFGTPLYIHHDYHHDHYRHSNRRSDRPARKAPSTPTRNPNPPPSSPISKGVPAPPSNPRDRR